MRMRKGKRGKVKIKEAKGRGRESKGQRGRQTGRQRDKTPGMRKLMTDTEKGGVIRWSGRGG